jgi:hypothetical protein
MKKVTPHSAPQPDAPQVGMAEPGPVGPTAGGRRSYRRPEVVKRRSLSQATLVSGGGTGGSLAGGMI